MATTLFIAWEDHSTSNSLIRVTTIDTSGEQSANFPNGGRLVTIASAGPQSNPSVTGDAVGVTGNIGAIAYQDNSSGVWKVYAQAYSANGQPAWGANPVAVSSAASFQTAPHIIPSASNKSYYIVWQDSTPGNTGVESGQKLMAQMVDGATGSLKWSAPVNVCVNTTGDQTECTAISDGNGGIMVVWLDSRNAQSPPFSKSVFAQDINPSGSYGWNTTQGVQISGQSQSSQNPVMTANIGGPNAGIAIVAWQAFDPASKTTDTDIYAQAVDGSGNLVWNLGIPVSVCNAPNNQTFPSIVSDDSTGAIIAWQDLRNAPKSALYAQRVNINSANGPVWSTNGNLIASNPSGAISNIGLTGDGADGAHVVWLETVGAAGGLGVVHVNSSGMSLWSTNGIQCAPGDGSSMTNPVVTSFTFVNGDTIHESCILYDDTIGTSGLDIYGQRIGYTPNISTNNSSNSSFSSINYGTIHVSTSKTDTLDILNTGDDTLRITNISMGTANSQSFSYTVKNGLPLIIAPNSASKAVTVKYTALSNFSVMDSLTIYSNAHFADSISTVQLFGAGKFPHLTVISGDTANFGGVRVNSTKTQFIQLKNTGTDQLVFKELGERFYLEGASNFSDSGSDLFPLAPDSSLLLPIQFSPTDTGLITAQYKFIANDSSNLTPSNPTPVTIFLSGIGTAPALAFSTEEINFGFVNDHRIETRIISILNTGTDTLHLDSVFFTGSVAFVGTPIMDSTAIAPGQSLFDTISFTPDTTKIHYTAQLDIIADDTSLIHALYTEGYGTTSPVDFSTTAIEFNYRSAGSTNDTSLTVLYSGPDTAKIIKINRIGSSTLTLLSQVPITLLPGVNGTINMAWKPDNLLRDSATIQMITQYGEGGKSFDTTYITVTGNPAPTSVKENNIILQGITLSQCYPNPIGAGSASSSEQTGIDFSTDHFIERAVLNVYDVRGVCVANLYRGAAEAGLHHVVLSTGNINAGKYFYVLEANGGAIERMMTIIR